jgi:2-keto-4-pentenoate hydratase/2-oxohepta-3-ene-1,7-dioic acid hydratase in catechol pathway
MCCSIVFLRTFIKDQEMIHDQLRLCRFCLGDDTPVFGFYLDDRVVPVDEAAEAYAEEGDFDLIEPVSENLIDLLPPDGAAYDSVYALARWLDQVGEERREELSYPIEEVRLLTPLPRPPKVLLLAGNYAKHVAERGGTVAEREETFPYVFLKPSTTLAGPGDPIVLPRVSPDTIDWECELGVIIGRRCRDVTEEEALEYVAGYTVVNDISDRAYRPNPSRKPRERDAFFDWLHGKWHDGSCPIGPCILASSCVPDPQAFRLRLTVNGMVRQDAMTDQMVFPVAAVISFLSSWMTLEPGDVISTGTPSGVGSATGQYLRPGDLVVAEISGIGRLVNRAEGESTSRA